jgi:hypothetical protein
VKNGQAFQIQRQRNALPKMPVVNIIPGGNKGAVQEEHIPNAKPLNIGVSYGR